MRETILITGAAGRVANMISPTLRSTFRLRRLDLRPIQVEGDDEALTGDVRDVDLVQGPRVERVVRLGGPGPLGRSRHPINSAVRDRHRGIASSHRPLRYR